jgi:hypothetical protein
MANTPAFMRDYEYEKLMRELVNVDYPTAAALRGYKKGVKKYKKLLDIYHSVGNKPLDFAAKLPKKTRESLTQEALTAMIKDVLLYGTLKDFENEWANFNLLPLQYLMGDSFVASLYGVDTQYRLTSPKSVQQPTMIFESRKLKFDKVGEPINLEECTGHFMSMRPGDTKVFNPYTHYQMLGTQQFCQTFALLYAVGQIPDVGQQSDNPHNYYEYNKLALMFMRHTVEHMIPPTYDYTWINDIMMADEENPYNLGLSANPATAKLQMLHKIDECIRQYRACINVL